MVTATLGSFLERLKQASAHESLAPLSDRELVARFLAERDEAAFQVILQRHGPMVFRVCRRVLAGEQDAEDAFQATFLVLARRADTIRKRTSLASWLHGVAFRIACDARDGAARRRRHETRTRKSTPATLPDETTWKELRSVLDEELARLPERLRGPLALCYLEGLTQDEAARQLGQSKAMCRRSLERGRALLGARLTRRGVALSAALFAPLLADSAASAAVPPGLIGSTVEAAARVAAGQAATVAASARVAALTEGALKAMLSSKLKVASALLFLALGGAVAWCARLAPAQDREGTKGQPPAVATDSPPQKAKEPAEKEGTKGGPTPADLLKMATEAAHAIDDQTPRIWVLVSIAEAQARAGEKETAAKTWAEAVEVARAVTRHDKWHRFADIAAAQARVGDVKGAKETADLIEDNLGTRDSALSKIAIAQADRGDLKGAEETIASVSSEPWKGEALRAYTAAQVKVGKVKPAASTASGITDDLSWVVALLTLARAHRAIKDNAAAAEILRQARKVVEGIEDDEKTDTRAVAEGALAEGLAEAGDVKEARQRAGAIKKAMWKAGALWRVAGIQTRAGDLKGALETAETIEDVSLRESAIQEIVSAQVGGGDLKGAHKTFELLKRPYWRAEALIEIAKAQAKAGDTAAATKSFDRAFEEAQGVEEREGAFGNASNACHAHIVRAMAEAGREKDAAAWATRQTTPLLKAQALVNVVEGMAKRREAEKRPPEKK